MPDTLCRLAVHVAGPGEAATIDLVLPAEAALGELVPAIVDAVLGPGFQTGRWHLTRVAGAPLDPSISLRSNDLRDGDTVLLSTVAVPPPRRRPTFACTVVARPVDPEPERRAQLVTGLTGVVVCAAALVWSGLVTAAPWPLWSAAAVSVTAAGSVAAARTARPRATVLVTAAVVFAMATGVLAVPGASWVTLSLLGSSAGCAMSILLMYVTGKDGVPTAFAACTGAAAGATALCFAVTARLDVAGTALAVLSLIALSAAPKLTVLTAGLGPSRRDVDEERAAAAHRTLTALLSGWSISAALGGATVAVAALYTPASATAASVFVANLGLLLILRRRVHADVHRRVALRSAGHGALLIGGVVVVASAPSQAWWICLAAATGCVAGLWWPDHFESANPLGRHGIQMVEYLTLAAVVPLAFWVIGLYGVVRELSLS